MLHFRKCEGKPNTENHQRNYKVAKHAGALFCTKAGSGVLVTFSTMPANIPHIGGKEMIVLRDSLLLSWLLFSPYLDAIGAPTKPQQGC